MTAIEWTHVPGYRGETWNPVVGCQAVSPGCANCYAMRMASRLEAMAVAQRAKGGGASPHDHYRGLTAKTRTGKTVWNAAVGVAGARGFGKPLRQSAPRCYFVNSMGDLFYEGVSDDLIDRVFAIMALCPQHLFIVLTKRAARMRAYAGAACERVADAIFYLRRDTRPVGPLPHLEPGARWWPLANVWLGVSAEDQRRAEERIPDLLATPAAKRLVSCEPLIGGIDLTRLSLGNCPARVPGHPMIKRVRSPVNALAGAPRFDWPGLDWVIVGGESGPGARPMHPDWARRLRDQCADAGVPFFFKQWGDWAPVEIEEDEGATTGLTPAYPMTGCGDPAAHKHGQPCLFWQDGALVCWPVLETLPAVGARRVGKQAAGAMLDGRAHRAFPEETP